MGGFRNFGSKQLELEQVGCEGDVRRTAASGMPAAAQPDTQNAGCLRQSCTESELLGR